MGIAAGKFFICLGCPPLFDACMDIDNLMTGKSSVFDKTNFSTQACPEYVELSFPSLI